MIYLHKTQLYNKHENPNYALDADNYFCARLQKEYHDTSSRLGVNYFQM